MTQPLNGTVTDRKRNEVGEPPQESGTPDEARIEDPALVRTRARLRVRARSTASAVFRFLCSASRLFGAWALTVWRRALACSPYTDRPASVRDVVEYTRAGGWVPGDNPWWVEAPGKAYGWVIAIPATVIMYVIAWVIQRPTRLTVSVIVYFVLRHYFPALP